MREPASQWVNCLAIFLGGVAIMLPQLNRYLSYLFVNFLIVGAILGFFWPERSWRWGLWLAVPVVTLGIINLAVGQNVGAIVQMVSSGAQAVVAGALMGWLGFKFSPRRLPFQPR